MDGFEWSPPAPYVPMEPGEDGWCVRDAVCEMFRWKYFSPEWCRFIEWPQGRDVSRLAEHLGLTMFESPQNWNDFGNSGCHCPRRLAEGLRVMPDDKGPRGGTVLVRDTTQQGAGPVLRITPGAWRNFTSSIK